MGNKGTPLLGYYIIHTDIVQRIFSTSQLNTGHPQQLKSISNLDDQFFVGTNFLFGIKKNRTQNNFETHLDHHSKFYFNLLNEEIWKSARSQEELLRTFMFMLTVNWKIINS